MTGQNIVPRTGVNMPGNRNKYSAIEALVEKAVHGDSNALYSLCESVIDSVLYHAKYILGNVMDAEDVTQNIMLRMCENIRGLREPKAFRAWLGGIEVNETRRFMAEHAKHVNVVNIDDYSEGLSDENAEHLPSAYVDGKYPDIDMMEMVSRLPIRQREAVILRYFDDLSVTEVAHAMKISHQNVSRYLNLAQKKLRNELKKSTRAVETGAVAMLPVSRSLFEAFQPANLNTCSINTPWVQNALTQCRQYVAESCPADVIASSANIAETTAAAMRLSSGAVMGILSAVFVVGAVAIGKALGGMSLRCRKEARPQNRTPGAEGRIVFNGSVSHQGTGRINPKSVEAQVKGADGELEVLRWWITQAGSDDILYEGGGKGGGKSGAKGGAEDGIDGVSAALRGLEERGVEGEYNLFFRLEDESGEVYMVLGNFFIKNFHNGASMASGRGVLGAQ